jgi:ABC-type multidrug transport system permease subunit
LYHQGLIENKIKLRTLPIIWMTNLMDITCVLTLFLFDKRIKNRINLSHLPNMKKILAIFLAPYKILIYLLLLLEVLQINMNFFTLIYVMLFYMLMRA